MRHHLENIGVPLLFIAFFGFLAEVGAFAVVVTSLVTVIAYLIVVYTIKSKR